MLHRGLIAVALSLSVTACAGNGVKGGPANAAVSQTEVKVSNNNWSDMTVYVERGGLRSRLGTVVSMTTRIFRVPRSFSGSTGNIRLIADPIGSTQTHATLPIQVMPGQRVDFTIENHLAVSSISVWDR